MALDTFSNFKTAVADWLNRSDLTSAIPDFITLAEAGLRKDRRLENVLRETITVSAEATTLNSELTSDFRALKYLYHDGATYYGEIEIVPAEKLSHYKQTYGATGVPRAGALLDGVLVLAPAPDTSYTLDIVYEWELVALSDSAPSNWLLANHPDIYLYATLVESAPYLKDDPRIVVWKAELEKRLNDLFLDTQRREFSGRLVARPRHVIGG